MPVEAGVLEGLDRSAVATRWREEGGREEGGRSRGREGGGREQGGGRREEWRKEEQANNTNTP